MRLPPSTRVEPAYDNSSSAGQPLKGSKTDRFNSVTEFSAQAGSGGKDLSQQAQRHAHQKNLLSARLNTFLDTAYTPGTLWKKTVAPSDPSYAQAPIRSMRNARVLPSFSQARGLSMRSFNEGTAASKLTQDYLRSDPEVRARFIEDLVEKSASSGDPARTKLETLTEDLLNIKEEKFSDLGSLQRKRELLQQCKSDTQADHERHKIRATASLLVTNSKLSSVDKKMAAIQTPSSYEMHLVENGGKKVTDRRLHVEELKDRARGISNATTELTTKKGIQNFTGQAFDKLARAIRDFQAIDLEALNPAEKERKINELRLAALPILYSKEREAVHRFIVDMTRQLKRAGVDVPEESLKELRELIPEQRNDVKMMQKVIWGTGKQMRLQDEAERMAKALPKVLQLASTHRQQLKNNLMDFDLTGVKELMTILAGNPENPSLQAMNFVKSHQGQQFIKVMIELARQTLGPEHEGLINYLHANRKDPAKAISCLSQLVGPKEYIGPLFEKVVNENQHIFMVTSDTEFWEKEAIDKVATRLVETDDPHTKSRIFKQMKMRGAALGMDENAIDAFMMQGIANTLRNRNMAVAGTRLSGIVGAVGGNLASTPVSAALTAVNPIFITPGLTDLFLVPTGWFVGLAPGYVFGRTVMEKWKQDRLAEAKETQGPEYANVFGQSGTPAAVTYKYDGKKWALSAKTMVKRKEAEKPTLNAMSASRISQFRKMHGAVWKDLVKEVASAGVTTKEYAVTTWGYGGRGVRAGVSAAKNAMGPHNNLQLVEQEDTRPSSSSIYSYYPRSDYNSPVTQHGAVLQPNANAMRTHMVQHGPFRGTYPAANQSSTQYGHAYDTNIYRQSRPPVPTSATTWGDYATQQPYGSFVPPPRPPHRPR